MLPKFEYGHLYKFVVSIGMLLVGLAVVIPWLVLRESAPLLVPEEELRKLTPVAQAVMRRKQQDARWFVEAYRWISLALAVAGGVCVFIGLRGWKDRQEVEDSKQVAERDVTLASLRQMTPQEVEDKREAEATEIEAEANAAEGEGLPTARVAYVELIDRIERRLWRALRIAYGDAHLATNVRTPAGEVDAFLLRATQPIVMEVKYVRSLTAFGRRAREARLRLTRVLEELRQPTLFSGGSAPDAVGVAILVTPHPQPGFIPSEDEHVRIVVIAESRIDDLDPAELRHAIEHGGVIA